MSKPQTAISRAVSDILTGHYSRKRLNQERIAETAGMSLTTVQKKLAGKAPITATDLVVLSSAIGVSPAKVIEEAVEEVGFQLPNTAAASDAPASLDDARAAKQEEAANMTGEELDRLNEERSTPIAATHDIELEQDEPEAP